MSLVIVTSYTGNLVAALTAKDIRLPFRTLEELAEDTEYTLQVPRGSVHMTLLQVFSVSFSIVLFNFNVCSRMSMLHL